MKGQFPWIGRSRGSAGGMTTSKINDKNVMRTKAFDVSNPKTAAQVMQRDFFKQVQEVCASVTEDQLRSLFGVKPKTMTRRNALSKQIAAAYTITNGVKSVDFSKLQAIGNGEKIDVQILQITKYNNPLWDFSENPGLQEMPLNANFIVIGFNEDEKSIQIFNTDLFKEEGDVEIDIDSLIPENKFNGFVYVTYATNGINVYGKSFGSFIIKTRATD